MPDLTTLRAFEDYLPLPPGNDDEPALAALITAASAAIATYCGRSFVAADYTELRSGGGGRTLVLFNQPIVAVASVTVDGVAIPAGSVTQPGFYFTPLVLALNGYRFGRGIGNVAIAYTGGFDAAPPDIAQACNEMVALMYRERAHIDLAAETVAAQTTSFVHKLNPRTQGVLDSYRRMTPVWP
ncbi:MAG TPA: hypothetical protein VMU87_01010 [Stellaceae bacterium]|nr:hypothetical protein [Stellaceae bacterium]